MISEEMLKQLSVDKPKKVRVTIEFNDEFGIGPQTFEMDKFHFELSADPQQEWKDGKLIVSLSNERRVKISGTFLNNAEDRPKVPMPRVNKEKKND